MGQGTDSFTSLPKEGMLRSTRTPEKSNGRVRTHELGVPEASMLTTRPPKPLWTRLSLHIVQNVADLLNNLFIRQES